MKVHCDNRVLAFFVLFVTLLFLPLASAVPPAWGGSMRITMTDGKTVDVPYYWEESGEIKFELTGGIAGFPRSQVASIQEVLTSKEFDPEVLLESPDSDSNSSQGAALKDLVNSKSPANMQEKVLPSEEGLKLLALTEGAKKPRGATDRVYAPRFKVEGNFAEAVRSNGDKAVLVMRNILSSRVNLKDYGFTLNLYDADGNVLQKKPCEVYELDIDQKTLKNMEIRGRLFSVVATVEPNMKIKRYDITAAQR